MLPLEIIISIAQVGRSEPRAFEFRCLALKAFLIAQTSHLEVYIQLYEYRQARISQSLQTRGISFSSHQSLQSA